MSEPSSQDPKDKPLSNPIDLSDLQSFSFGTQWSDAGKSSKGDAKSTNRENRSRSKPDRRPGGGPPRRDRRPKRPVPAQGDSSAQPPFQSHSGDRRDGRGGDRRGFRRQQGGDRPQRQFQEQPYESSVFEVGFYPEDAAFSTVIKAMRTNHLTYELFEIAKTFLLKPERFIASVKRKAKNGEKAEKVFISLPDSMPFATEDEAIVHAATHYPENFFNVEEVEVEPPTGNFQFVNRCSKTKVLLGPPNYHRYEETLKHHHRTRFANLPLEKAQSFVETVREQEVIDEWLESMKKTTRYTTKAAEGEESQSFDSFDDALVYLRTSQKAKLVKEVNYARVDGKDLEKFKDTEASKAVFGELARQQRFPLETANAIRGRLRREKFSIYKKGSKGVTFVCSTKRNFRTAGQVMSQPLDRIIRFLEANPYLKAKDLPPKFEEWLKTEAPDESLDEKQLFKDLHWLIADGYVSHFSNDTLFAQPVLDNTPKPKEAKSEDESPKASEPAPSEDTSAEPTVVSEAVEEAAAQAEPVASQEAASEMPSSNEAATAPEAEVASPQGEAAPVAEEAPISSENNESAATAASAQTENKAQVAETEMEGDAEVVAESEEETVVDSKDDESAAHADPQPDVVAETAEQSPPETDTEPEEQPEAVAVENATEVVEEPKPETVPEVEQAPAEVAAEKEKANT